jgi:cell division protein FtsZ
VIINISGDISLMDANDAASYVQDLAGDDANIIFGAKYDESMTDAATITVIATGLEENGRPAQKVSATAASSVINNMRYDTQTATRPSTMGTTVNGLHNTAASARPTTPVQPASNPTLNGIQRPRQPESTVKPVEINIPDFLKNSKR